MHAFWALVSVICFVSLIVSTFYLRGRQVRQTVRELFGVGRQRVGKLLNEFRRKTFHLVGLLIPGLYFYGNKTGILPRRRTAMILGSIFAVLFLIDFLRLISSSFAKVYYTYFGRIMRAKEANRINGTVMYVAGCTLTIIAFEPLVAVCAMLFLNLGDMVAAMVGMSMGRTKIYGGKSLEGSLAMFAVCFAVAIITYLHAGMPLVEYIAVIGALSATLAELFPIMGIDDNFAIPLVSGLCMTLSLWRLGIAAAPIPGSEFHSNL